MLALVWLLPCLPLAGFLVLALAGRRLTRAAAGAVGVGSVAAAALLALALAVRYALAPPSGDSYTVVLWSWMRVSALTPEIAFTLDPLSLVMVLVVCVVGFFIHLYSVEYMAADEGFARFFAVMNLFVAAMLTLVLADNLVLLYLGWEGVGLCSFLLIGFWYRERANVDAARKAFVVTRLGDVAMLIGLLLLLSELGTLRIAEVLERAPVLWTEGSGVAIAAAALLLGGAVGKSAQLPLQTWLPDAMAGPTPVSALIHAATMVTAGVYLIARTHELFVLAPAVLAAVAVIGAATLLLGAVSALAQRDIKRVLAYSTISQLGYMFLALGVGAWSAAVFHLATHAVFKALLFLAAGAVITALHHEQDIFAMGGLRRRLPGLFWPFLIGGAALAGLPLVTAGFYSKDLILWEAFASELGSVWLWAAALLGAALTAFYVFRLIFVVFFGPAGPQALRPPGARVMAALASLAALSLVAGFVETPATLGHVTVLSGFLEPALPASSAAHDVATEALLQVLAALAFVAGLAAAYVHFLLRRDERIASQRLPGVSAGVERFLRSGFGFDQLYGTLFVRPVLWFARVNRDDAIDRVYQGVAAGARAAYGALAPVQNGRLRRYAVAVAWGCAVLVALVVFG
jgi:NADH-quinone oxidoreductase subunit L